MTTDLDDTFDPAPPLREAKPTRDDILGALKWSTPVERATKNGPRMVSDALANDLVFALWSDESESLKTAGYSLGRFPRETGPWRITKWEKMPEKIIVQRAEAKALSRATDADINVPCPEGLSFLGYQRAGIAFGFERPAVIIADEMGLGKTPQSIGIINCMAGEAKRILIVCPASLKINWRRECERFLVRKRPIFIADSKVFPDLADGIVIVNYDVLHKHEAELRGTEWDVVIFDEAHYCKNPKSRRTKMAFGVRATAKEKANGAADVPGIMAKKRILLTGTPIANKPVELFPLINYLDPITWNNFFKFAIRYCGAHKNGFGREFDGASNLDELQDKLRSTIMVRRLKKDVLTELPPKRRQVIEFAATGELARVARAERDAYEGVDELEAEVELAAASDDPNAYEQAVQSLAKGQKAAFEGMSTLRLETGRAIIPMAIENIRETLEEVPKLVIFGHHKEVLAAIKAELGDAAVMIVGDTPMAERQANADRFQKDPSCTAIIGSFGAMGVGWTLTAASNLVTVEQDWVPGNVSQAEDRIHRIGQKESVLIRHLVIEGSIGATIMKRMIAKQDVIDKALDAVAVKPAAYASGLPERPKGDPRDLLAAEADKMTPDQRDAAREAIRWLADRCNGARDWDGAGFSKIDTVLGKDLAARSFLSKKQCALARKVAWKYRGQLPEALVERIKL